MSTDCPFGPPIAVMHVSFVFPIVLILTEMCVVSGTSVVRDPSALRNLVNVVYGFL